MKTKYAVALALLMGIGIGATVMQLLHMRKKSVVYFIAENEVTDPEGYRTQYLPTAQKLLKEHGARYLAQGKATQFAGDPPKGRVVILEWDSMEQARGWFESPEYQATRKIGEQFAKYRNFAIEGDAP